MPPNSASARATDLIDAGGIPDVAGGREGLTPVGADCFRHGLRPGTVPIKDDDACALLCKQLGRGFSNAGPGSGNERGFPVQPAKRLIFHNLPQFGEMDLLVYRGHYVHAHGLVKGKLWPQN